MSEFVRSLSYRSAGLWRDGMPRLQRVDVELTERCNNACRHCYINLPPNDGKARAKELSAEEIETFLAEAAALGALGVSFTGGEPLLRGDFERVYLSARRLGLQVLIATNAVLITPALADLFARIPPLLPIRITVYGMTEKSYEAVSGVKGSYRRFRRGVSLLRERGVPLALVGTALPQVRSDRARLAEWAAELDCAGRPGWVVLLYLRARRDSEANNDLIRALRITPDESLAFLLDGQTGHLAGLRELCRSHAGPGGQRLFDCGAGRNVCLGASGRLQPCLALHAPETSYDWRAGSLGEALDDYFVGLRTRTATNPDYLSRCARCFLHGLCEQCPAWSWMEHGTFDTPVEYVCEVAHAQARALGLLEEGERSWQIENWKERLEWM